MRSWLSQLSEMLVGRSDVILVSSQASTYQLGLYSIVALIPQLSYQVFATLIQQSYARNPTLSLVRRTTLLWMTCALAGAALILVAIPAAYWLVPIIFGAEFSNARNYLLPAAAVTFGLSNLAPVINDVALRKRPAPILAASLSVVVAGSVGIAALTDVPVALFSLSGMFVALSATYILLLNRGKIQSLRISQFLLRMRPD